MKNNKNNKGQQNFAESEHKETQPPSDIESV